jgi:SEC-C motif-containing protein
MLDPSGTVEFRAGYTRRGVPGVQHELSRFVRESGQWVYLGEAEV